MKLDWSKIIGAKYSRCLEVDSTFIPMGIDRTLLARVQIVLEGEMRIRRLKIFKELWGLKVKWDIPHRCKNKRDILEQGDVPEELASYVIWAYQRTSPDDDPGVMSMRIHDRLGS
ncbi:MAG: hypothetical protein GTO42_01290 [Candidatus Latescibacteria bacterium]|nr:hypothetical protein [Candidatus Latescibacterota bacterium]NIO27163.1 hypothetical protein [Candidatus Latescibacterota bacterium]NIO54687.1 hypothetical protein [Candidatus Latescibacterota bacterium]NIT00770.1 hypothetical protein [Candidatus Latescibacterota bacterium]NIT37693.1 hypothetical protein [Candidatus Latescibacterota bacterium]